MRTIRVEIDRNEERFRQLSDKVDKNKVVDAEMTAELQGVQAGEERRGTNCGCRSGEVKVRCFVPGVLQKNRGLYPFGADARRRNSEDEQEQAKASQQLALSASGGFNEGTPASGMELDLPRVPGAHGEGGGARNSGAAKDERKRLLSNFRSRLPMEEGASLGG